MTRRSQAPRGAAFWILTAIGLGIVGFGLIGLLRNADATQPVNWLTYVFGSLIAHDALWAPAVAVASVVLVRLAPRWALPWLQGALVVSAGVVLVSIPALTGRGRIPSNPSILPNDYRGNVLLVLGLVWAVAIVLALWARRRRVAP